MNSAIAVSDGPLVEGELERGDFSRLALDLLFSIEAAHPKTVDLTDIRDLAIAEPHLTQIWFYLKHQGIVVGEVTEGALTSSGHQSVHAVLEPYLQNGSAAGQFAGIPAGKSASTLLLGVMRHQFALQASTI